MKKHAKPNTRSRGQQDPRLYITPAAKRYAECVAAVDAFRRTSRRCGKALGRGCTPLLVEMLVAEMGGANG